MKGSWFLLRTIEDLKKLNVTDLEVPELIRLKKAGITEETIVAPRAHRPRSPAFFSATDPVSNLAGKFL